MSVPLGQPQRLTFRTFSDPAKTTLADPTAVTLYLKDPTGTIAPYTWASGAVTRESVGVFHYDLPVDVPGFYQYRWVATGAVATSSRAGAVSIDDAFPAALVSVEDAKAHLKVPPTDMSSDDTLQGFIFAASAELLGLTDYRIGDVVTPDTYTEWTDAGSDTVMLKHYPVTAITSVTEYAGGTSQVLAAEPLDGGSFTGYGWDFEDGTGANGLLVRLSGGSPVRWCGRRVKIVYTAGSGAVPQDVRIACLDLVQFWWTQSQAAGTQTYGEPDFGLPTPFGIPRAVTDKLSAYRRAPVVA